MEEWKRMQAYNGKDLARAFQTVRGNTIKIAEEIPEEQYGYRVAEGTRTVGETLAHMATSTAWPLRFHGERMTQIRFDVFMGAVQNAMAAAAALTTKAQLLDALKAEGD